MTDAGWVAVEQQGGEGQRQRKVYHPLPAGVEELTRWASEPDSSGTSNRALLVKLRAEAVLGPLGVRQELERLMTHHEERLATYRQIEQRDFGGDELSTAQQLQYRVLCQGIMNEETWLAWARDTLTQLDRLPGYQ